MPVVARKEKTPGHFTSGQSATGRYPKNNLKTNKRSIQAY
jgi:hypothetical protein